MTCTNDEPTEYLKNFDYLISEKFTNRKYFFPSNLENAYSTNVLTYYFHIIWYKSFPRWKGKIPRVYDFRHHFAWYNINEWARNKDDVNAMLPYLMRLWGITVLSTRFITFDLLWIFMKIQKKYQKNLRIEFRRSPMSKKDAVQFWNLASKYLDHHLKNIWQVSSHTIESYRFSLNHYICYLEEMELIKRKNITFNNFDKQTLLRYQEWMIAEKKLSPKTCNLRMTAIRSLLEYAFQDEIWITPLYNNARDIVNVKVVNHPIEYFEAIELAALLKAPEIHKKIGRRNQMILILMYDIAARVLEIRHIKLSDLHLDARYHIFPFRQRSQV